MMFLIQWELIMDHETAIRTSIANQLDNERIINIYNIAISSGYQNWLAHGGKLFDQIQKQLSERGII